MKRKISVSLAIFALFFIGAWYLNQNIDNPISNNRIPVRNVDTYNTIPLSTNSNGSANEEVFNLEQLFGPREYVKFRRTTPNNESVPWATPTK